MTMKGMTAEQFASLVNALSAIRDNVKTTKEKLTLTDEQKEHNKPIDKELRNLRTAVETLEKSGFDVPEQFRDQIAALESKRFATETVTNEPDEETLNSALTSMIELVGLQELVYKAASKLHNETDYTFKKEFPKEYEKHRETTGNSTDETDRD